MQKKTVQKNKSLHFLNAVRIFCFFLSIFHLASWSFADQADVVELTNNAFTEGLSRHFVYLLDEKEELSPFDILLPESENRWQKLNQNVLNLGRLKGALWLKFQVNAQASIHKQWELVVRSAFPDYIDVYQVFSDVGPRVIYRSGVARPFNNRSEDHRYYIIPLDIYENPETFLIRLETGGPSYMPMELYPENEFWAPLQLEDVFNWLYFGVILAMSIYNLFLFSVIRDSRYLYYVLFILNFALLHLSLDGYLFQYFWHNDKPYYAALDFVFLSTSTLFGFLFIATFLQLKKHNPLLNRLLHLIGILQLPIALFLLIFTDLEIHAWILLFTAALLVFAAALGCYANMRGFATARFFFIAWVVFAIGNGYLIAALMGFTLFDFPPLVASKIAAIAEALLLSFALAHRIRTLTDERESHRLKVEAQSYFLAQISHEIRTPLNGVLGTLELMSHTNLNDEQKSYLNIIQSSGRSLLTLVNDVLDYTKIEAGKMSLQKERIAIHDLVRFQVELYRSQAEQKNLELTIHIENKVPRFIESDTQRIRQLLSNLISNAIKFTDDGYVRVILSVELVELRPFLSIKVKDSGIGISPHEQKRLFDAYQQLELSGNRVVGGTGLGLTICKELAELLGGSIDVDSQLHKGSEFKLLFPMNTLSEEINEESNETTASVNNLAILVAEDNVVNQKVIKGLLTKAGHAVTIVAEGKQAVAERKKCDSEYDLILMDCEMPLMDGYEAASLIRQYEKENGLPEIPIIALTAQALEEVRQRCLAVGMNDFLAKPINFSQLIRTIAQTI